MQLVDLYTGMAMQIPMSGDSMAAGYGNTLVIAPSGGPPHVLRYSPGETGRSRGVGRERLTAGNRLETSWGEVRRARTL